MVHKTTMRYEGRLYQSTYDRNKGGFVVRVFKENLVGFVPYNHAYNIVDDIKAELKSPIRASIYLFNLRMVPPVLMY